MGDEFELIDYIKNKIQSIELNRIPDKKSKQYHYQQGCIDGLNYCLKKISEVQGD